MGGVLLLYRFFLSLLCLFLLSFFVLLFLLSIFQFPFVFLRCRYHFGSRSQLVDLRPFSRHITTVTTLYQKIIGFSCKSIVLEVVFGCTRNSPLQLILLPSVSRPRAGTNQRGSKELIVSLLSSLFCLLPMCYLSYLGCFLVSYAVSTGWGGGPFVLYFCIVSYRVI